MIRSGASRRGGSRNAVDRYDLGRGERAGTFLPTFPLRRIRRSFSLEFGGTRAEDTDVGTRGTTVYRGDATSQRVTTLGPIIAKLAGKQGASRPSRVRPIGTLRTAPVDSLTRMARESRSVMRWVRC